MAVIPTRNISSFKSKLTGGGARPNLFEVAVTFPTTVTLNLQNEGVTAFDSDNFRFLCKSAALPASNVTPIEIPFRGRVLKVAGDRTFDTWTVTVINDSNFSHRRAFETWMQNVAQYSDHSGLTNPANYMGNATVYQLGRIAPTAQGQATTSGNANILAQYQFVDIFPTTVSDIALSYDTTDAIEEFTVDFQVQYFYPQTPGA